MDDFRPILYRRYSRWVRSATADGTSEQDAKRIALAQRRAKQPPHEPEWEEQRPFPPVFVSRAWKKWRVSRDPRIIDT